MTAGDVRATLHHAASSGLGDWLLRIETTARRIALAAGLDPDRPGYRERPIEKGSEADTADCILRRIKILRSAIAEVNIPEIICQVAQIERETNEHDFAIDYGSAILRGRAFENGPKGTREDALSILIKEALAQLGASASANEVVDFLKSNATVVQEIDADLTIFWRSRSGRERKTKFKSFQNRLKLKKRALETQSSSKN